jgi:hypothetical protein
MQTVRPPQGPRNPNGRSEADILAALKGLTGSRTVTFRYELLDKGNQKLRDMSEVASCRIMQNWLSTIKRQANFKVRVGGGLVDYLSDRIKPWIRLWIPPYGPQDYVEWPQGVFLLTTPQQETDDMGAVWRDIEGYDQLKVLEDEQLPTRFTTEGLLAVSDGFVRDVSDGSWGWSDSGHQWAFAFFADTVRGVTVAGGGYAFVRLTAQRSIIRAQGFNSSYSDVDVYATLGADQTATGASFLPGVMLRYQSNSAYYRMRVHLNPDSTVSLSVTRQTTQIGATVATSVTYTPGQLLNVRARVIDQVVQGKVWAPGTPEPAEWMVEEEVTVGPIGSGLVGFTASAFADNTNVAPELRFGEFRMTDNPLNLVTGVVRHVLREGGITDVAITPSPEQLVGVREWDPDTTRLTIVNDLLDMIAYESMSFDADGRGVVRPYVSPAERPAEYTYADDDESVMLPRVVRERDLHAIPNQWTLIKSEPDEPVITVTYRNSDPASPTSTVRRGRVISDVRGDEDAASEAAMIERAARLAFEASQVYEAVTFRTALMPVHDGNDVYKLAFEGLAISGTYSEHTWEMTLEAGATMEHRARRVISLTAGSDPTIEVGDVTVTGALEAGNIKFGSVTLSPVPNVPTPIEVTGLDLQGTGAVRVQVTPLSGVPGSTFEEASVRNPTPDGFTLWGYRRNSTATTIHWLAIRGA